MAIILDADTIIKLNRAGILLALVTELDCIIPEAVYREVVVDGKAHRHPDADKIEEILEGLQPVVVERVESAGENLGTGELATREIARRTTDSIVVSDDRRFLNQLWLEGIAFLTPADAVLLLAYREALTLKDAKDALERMRPLIRQRAYAEIARELTLLEGQQQ